MKRGLPMNESGPDSLVAPALKAQLLIVDDERDMLRLLERSIAEEIDCDIETAGAAHDAASLLAQAPFDVMLLDVRMPGMDGMEFLQRVRKDYPEVTVVMMTGHGTIDLAVTAIKHGAYDFLTKPFDHEKLIHLLDKALERSRLVRENRALQRRVMEQERFHQFVGASRAMMKVYDTIRLYGKTDATVLITGESGTGKDLAARAIHGMSARADQPYVAVNCPNLPEEILESELFGYRKGAFTNAVHDKIGLFLEARRGTIYLDEIGDISHTLQTKLLRVLQEKEIRPLGATKNISVDVRITASTNQDLRAKIADKSFREDLYYRLNVLSMEMPPLRERLEDIPLLTDHFLDRYCVEFGKERKRISNELTELFMRHPWPGNVRELENVLRRAIILGRDEVIKPEDIEWEESDEFECPVEAEVLDMSYKDAKNRVLERFNLEYIGNVLMRNDGNVTRAARQCGMERQALQQIMRRYGIKSEDYRGPQ